MYPVSLLVALFVHFTCRNGHAPEPVTVFKRIHDCSGKSCRCSTEEPSVVISLKTLRVEDRLAALVRFVYASYLCHRNDSCRGYNYRQDSMEVQMFDRPTYRLAKLDSCVGFEMKWKSSDENVTGPTNESNLALHRTTCLSSASPHPRHSWLAVDGLFGTDTLNSQCAHTGEEAPGSDTWFMVELGMARTVARIDVLTRSAPTQTALTRYVNLTTGVTNASWAFQRPTRGEYPLCDVFRRRPPNGTWIRFNCSPSTPPGRFVIVQTALGVGGSLCLCEVEVYASG